MAEPQYPEAIANFRGEKRFAGAPLLAVDPDDWPGAPAVLRAGVPDGIGATDWSFGRDADGDAHAVLSFSTVEPFTHIVLALNPSKQEHRAALEAAAETGYVVLTTIAYFEQMPTEQEVLDMKSSPVIALQIDAARVQSFLAQL